MDAWMKLELERDGAHENVRLVGLDLGFALV